MEKKGKKEVIKKKKEKVKLVNFEKIDITNVTDDEIIKSGIRYNTKSDYICYLIMFGIFVLAILPPILRSVIPKPVTEIEASISYITITCYKTSYRDNHDISSTLVAEYRDGAVQTVKIDFTARSKDEDKDKDDGYIISEVDELEKLNLKGVKRTKNGNTTTFDIDFENNPEYKENGTLKDYSYVPGAELDVLSKKSYKCTSENETKLEVIDVKTRKKVE